MKFLHSETIGLYNLLMPAENVWEIVSGLGVLSCLEFIDLNQNDINQERPYRKFVKLCEEMEIKLDLIELEMKKLNKPIRYCYDNDSFLQNLNKFLAHRNKDEKTYFHELEIEINQSLKDLHKLLKNVQSFVDQYYKLIEYKYILHMAKPLIAEREKM